MPLLIILVLAAVLLTVVYFRFMAPGGSRKCRWMLSGGAGPQLSRWRCEVCGVEAYSSDSRPPKECKRTLKSGL